MSAKMPPPEQALYPAASQALDELLERWKQLGMPPHGKAGMLMAAYVMVCSQERGMDFGQIVGDIGECLASQLEDSDPDLN